MKKKESIIKDEESGNILSEDDFVSMNFWLCRSNFFKHLENYILEEIGNIKDIQKGEIYLPFAAQKLLSNNTISIDSLDSESEWFGVTYKEDKENSMKKLSLYSKDGIYPIPLWKN